MADLQATIDELWERRDELSPKDPTPGVGHRGDRPARHAARRASPSCGRRQGRRARVAEAGGPARVPALAAWRPIEVGPFEFADKLPLKQQLRRRRACASCPGGSARWGSYLEPGVILMPSYVNIGARVGSGTMVDTWATVGSCAQIGKNVHLSGGVGIGGVLEPPQAAPVMIGDESMIGSRSMITQGARVGARLRRRRGHDPEPDDPGVRRARPAKRSRAASCRRLVRRRAELAAEGVSRRHVRRAVRPRSSSASTEGERHDKAQAQRHPARPRRQRLTSPTSCARTAELIDIPSVSHDEAAITDHIAAIFDELDGFSVDRVGANLVARTNLGHAQRLVLAGHTDTVPVNDNATARVDGDTLYGLGASDMKSGLAVFIELAEAIGRGDITPDVRPHVRVLRVRRSRARSTTACSSCSRRGPTSPRATPPSSASPPTPGSRRAARARSPSSSTFVGARAHSARPWTGVNAIHRAGVAIDRVRDWPGRQPVIDDCEYREAMQVVLVSGGVARNVVPDRCVVTINHRFAPDHDLDDARAAVRAVVGDAFDEGDGDTWNEIDVSAAAPPSLGHPLLAALVERSGRPPRAKLGWTDVAFFAEQSHPGGQLRPGRSAAGAHAGRIRHAGATRRRLAHDRGCRHGVMWLRRPAVAPWCGHAASPSVCSSRSSSSSALVGLHPAAAADDPLTNRQWGLTQIHAPAAWSVSTGNGIKIGIVDSGVNRNHEDLAGKVIASATCVEHQRQHEAACSGRRQRHQRPRHPRRGHRRGQHRQRSRASPAWRPDAKLIVARVFAPARAAASRRPTSTT